jgi:hypothetical protein
LSVNFLTLEDIFVEIVPKIFTERKKAVCEAVTPRGNIFKKQITIMIMIMITIKKIGHWLSSMHLTIPSGVGFTVD